MTIVKLLNMTAGGILRWAVWRRVAFLREMVNVAASFCPPTSHTKPTPYLAHTKPAQIYNACAFGNSWNECNCWQSMVRPGQCLKEEVGYLGVIVGYCSLMLDASASIGGYLRWYCEESMRLPLQPFLWPQ